MILRAENIQKIYGSRKVVQDISLEVKQGEIIGLLGPNGAGKTTSFYMIVGMVKPNAGHIYLNDEEITGDAMYKRAQKGIGYLAQEASVFRKLSVEDNIKSVLQFTNLSKKEQKIKLESLIEEFNIGHVRKNRGDLLSGGERLHIGPYSKYSLWRIPPLYPSGCGLSPFVAVCGGDVKLSKHVSFSKHWPTGLSQWSGICSFP